MVFVQLDPIALAVTAGLIVAVSLPLIGVLTEQKRENTMNLIRHGFYSLSALIATAVLVSVFMIPGFLGFAGGADAFGFFRFPFLWFHALTGFASLALGVVLVVAWLREPLAEMACSRLWKLMIPTIVVWILALVLGVLVNVFGLR